MDAGQVTTAAAARADGAGTTLRSRALVQQILRVRAGEPAPDASLGPALLFVAAGAGTLRLNGEEHRLRPDTGAFVSEADEVEITSEEPLELVRVQVPSGAEAASARVVSLADQEAESAGIGREFVLLAACSEATQFVGFVPPGRAKMHNHPYDELAYVVEGDGIVHWHDGSSVPVGSGSCIHFPRLVFHSLENVGRTTLRIMGVFHPAGSPADRVAVLDY